MSNESLQMIVSQSFMCWGHVWVGRQLMNSIRISSNMYGSCIPEKPQTVTLPNISTSRQCWHCFGNSDSEMLLFIFHGWKKVTAALTSVPWSEQEKEWKWRAGTSTTSWTSLWSLPKTSPSAFCLLLFDQNGVTWPLYLQMRLENIGFQLGTWLSQRE